MSEARGHILPFFIPHLGCPHLCIFCDQQKISGCQEMPTQQAVSQQIMAYNQQFASAPELAYYGGSFTALSREQQIYFLEPAYKALEDGLITGIRVSTRPDYMDKTIINLLQEYGVSTVELGVQSMVDQVLQKAQRGQNSLDSLKAVVLLKAAGFTVGVQLMPGLPGETIASAIWGANQILALKPDLVRIYPTVVLRGTKLEDYYRQGQYEPLSLDEASYVSLAVYMLSNYYGAKVIRMGLQPTVELAKQVVAGPYHPAFGNLVYSRLALEKLLTLFKLCPEVASQPKIIRANPKDVGQIIGQQKANLKTLVQYWQNGCNIKVLSEDMPIGQLEVEAIDGKKFIIAHQQFATCWLKELAEKYDFKIH